MHVPCLKGDEESEKWNFTILTDLLVEALVMNIKCEKLLVLVTMIIGLLFSVQAMAAGTTQGTSVSNSASVDYQVSAVPQATITSTAISFLVDRKIDLTVANIETAAVNVVPGTNDNVLRFTVTNNSNDTLDFNLAATALNGTAAQFAGTDNVDADGTVAIFVENGTTPNTYQSGEDTATYINDLAADATIYVYVVTDFGTGFSNGDIASYHLEATARDSAGTPGAALTADTDGDTAGTVEDEFADAAGSNDSANDAKHSNYQDYKITTAEISISKTSAVVYDPVNNVTNPIAIPGARIEYTITVSNGGTGSTATNVIVTDSLATEITNGTVAFYPDGYAALKGIEVTAPNINGGAALALTNANDADEGDFNITTTNVITVDGITLLAGENATVKFQVTVQ